MSVDEQADWMPIWALPNVMIDKSIVRDQVGIMHCRDERVRAEAERYPDLKKFLSAFKDEFSHKVWPSIMMISPDADASIRTVAALGGFRDAICLSAIVNSHAKTLKWKRPVGVRFSDSFDVYPWTLGKDRKQRVYAITPGIMGTHDLLQLKAKPAPALPNRHLREDDLDRPLLDRLLDRWADYKISGNDTAENRKLFRALDMARSASRMPGGSDASFYDAGRAVSLWVSAFEILAHDGKADLPRVLALLGKVEWKRPKLQTKDKVVSHGRGKNRVEIPTNVVGATYKALYAVRNKFLHGEPVEAATLTLPDGRHVLNFAAPMFRLALTAFLDLKFEKPMPNMHEQPKEFGKYCAENWAFCGPQDLTEDAMLLANEPPEPGENEE